MILMPGHNPMGNVIHMLVGPETELYMDVHGSVIVDVSELLNNMVRGEPVFLTVTRSKDEFQTLQGLQKTGVKAASTFIGQQPQQAAPGGIQGPSEPKGTNKVQACSYCGVEKELAPVPNFKICQSCLQIELGLNRTAKSRGK